MVPTHIKIITLVLILAFLVFCLIVGKIKSKKQNSVEDYFLGGKKTNLFLMLGTTWASFAGGGFFVGYCGKGNLEGLSAYFQFFGEGLLAGIALGFIIGPYLARFKYFSMPHYISDYLYGGDLMVRRIGGGSAFCLNVVWSGAQMMALSIVLSTLFDVDYRISLIVIATVFIYYTVAGGVEAVIFTDSIQAIVQLALAICVIYFCLVQLDLIHGFGYLKSLVIATDPTKWEFADIPVVKKSSLFLLGFFGIIANPVAWNRAFCSDSVKSASISYKVAFTGNILIVFCSIALGMFIFTQTGYIGDQSLPYAIINYMPSYVTVLLGLGVTGATMSTADTHLNCGSANLIVDMIDPYGKIEPKKAVKYSRLSTLICGVVGVSAAMVTDSIYALGNIGYVVCGGVLTPMFIMGYIARDKSSLSFKSKIKPKAGRASIALGTFTGIIFSVVPYLNKITYGAIIPTILVTVISILVANVVLDEEKNIHNRPNAQIVE